MPSRISWRSRATSSARLSAFSSRFPLACGSGVPEKDAGIGSESAIRDIPARWVDSGRFDLVRLLPEADGSFFFRERKWNFTPVAPMVVP